MRRHPSFLPGDGFILLMFAVVLLSLLILIYDARRAEPAEWPQYHSNLDAAIDVCALRLLRELAGGDGIPLNARDGHGSTYDQISRLCEQDPLMLEYPERVTPEAVMNGRTP